MEEKTPWPPSRPQLPHLGLPACQEVAVSPERFQNMSNASPRALLLPHTLAKSEVRATGLKGTVLLPCSLPSARSDRQHLPSGLPGPGQSGGLGTAEMLFGVLPGLPSPRSGEPATDVWLQLLLRPFLCSCDLRIMHCDVLTLRLSTPESSPHLQGKKKGNEKSLLGCDQAKRCFREKVSTRC